ncbi:MAG TPA: MFS transporter [Gammaproteobacteria bacterium]|nr:MFS transporter [Gammaproteobacteria bacterium]
MLKTEKRAAVSLALIYAFRMIGLFMILPVFSLYAEQYQGATPLLIGLAIGIYGLTQGLFQLPFGFLSDRVGRKKMIVIGLLLFAAGSAVAATAETIQQVVAGRALQGMGAIAAVVMALAADLTREEVRVRVMASIGMSIGLAFMLSMIIGPVLASSIGMSGLFWVTGVLALSSIVVLLFLTPNPVQERFHRDAEVSVSDIPRVLANRELLRLDLGVFILHLTLAGTFVLFPLVLRDQLALPVARHWEVYLPVFVISIALMLPMIISAEKKARMKPMFLLGITLVLLSELGMGWFGNFWALFAMLVLFFGGFNFLEASMPSLVSKIAPADRKGTAMGLFSTAQFFGAFVGGTFGGSLLALGKPGLGFLLLAILPALWLLVAVFMPKPRPVSTRLVSLSGWDPQAMQGFAEQVRQLAGVREVAVFPEDEEAYLKVERGTYDEESLKRLLQGEPLRTAQ